MSFRPIDFSAIVARGQQQQNQQFDQLLQLQRMKQGQQEQQRNEEQRQFQREQQFLQTGLAAVGKDDQLNVPNAFPNKLATLFCNERSRGSVAGRTHTNTACSLLNTVSRMMGVQELSAC